jgi:preprotein translocase subunit SecB
MKAAQIELTDYFVSDLQFTANREFDVKNPSTSTVDDLQVTNQASPKADDLNNWQITLRIALNAPPDRNSPYSFLVEMIGFVHVADSVKAENIERLVRINGTSLVFSAAREIVRAVTSRGPFKPILLPTVTFWEAKPQAVEATPESNEQEKSASVQDSASSTPAE